MSEGQPLDVVIASDAPPEELPRSDMLSFENEQERSPEPLQPELSELLQLGREEWERPHREHQLSLSELQQQPELLLQLPSLELQQLQPLELESLQRLLLQQSQRQELYQQPQHQQRYPQGLVPQLRQQRQQPEELQVQLTELLQQLPLTELLQQLQRQELYQQPQHRQRYPQGLVPERWQELYQQPQHQQRYPQWLVPLLRQRRQRQLTELLQQPEPRQELYQQPQHQQPEPWQELQVQLTELLQQSQPQELYQQPQHQQRYEALSSFKLFLSDTLSRVTGADEITRGYLFIGTNGVIIHQLASVNSFTFEKRNLLSFGEALSMSLPPMVHISMILLSLALNFVLLFRVNPGIQCVLLLLCILMPLYYFAELAHKAAGIAVNLGRSYKMPLIWFSTLGGLGISLIGGSMVLLIVFRSWLYARRRGLEFQRIRVNGDAIIGAMNA